MIKKRRHFNKIALYKNKKEKKIFRTANWQLVIWLSACCSEKWTGPSHMKLRPETCLTVIALLHIPLGGMAILKMTSGIEAVGLMIALTAAMMIIASGEMIIRKIVPENKVKKGKDEIAKINDDMMSAEIINIYLRNSSAIFVNDLLYALWALSLLPIGILQAIIWQTIAPPYIGFMIFLLSICIDLRVSVMFLDN